MQLWTVLEAKHLSLIKHQTRNSQNSQQRLELSLEPSEIQEAYGFASGCHAMVYGLLAPSYFCDSAS